MVIDKGLAEEELLRLVGSAELSSQHPLAEALVEAAKEKNISLGQPDSFEAVGGRGVRATVRTGSSSSVTSSY